jgi:hypothetical protein
VSIARLVLEYLNALKWPIVAVVAIVIFRKPITELIGRLRTMKATVGGSSLELDAARRQVEKAAEEAVESVAEEVLAEGDGGPPAPGGLETRGGETRAGRPGATPEEYAAVAGRRSAAARRFRDRVAEMVVERDRRQHIEALIRTAVDYGWLTGVQLPNGPRPFPVIEWTEDGKPRIATFTGSSDPGEAPQRTT